MGLVSTEVGRPTRLHRGVQARCRPATAERRKDPGGGLARAAPPAQRGAAVEAALRSWRHGGHRHERGRRPSECPNRKPNAAYIERYYAMRFPLPQYIGPTVNKTSCVNQSALDDLQRRSSL